MFPPLDSSALAFAHADALWALELDRLYGASAKTARLLSCGKGELNSTLRSLWLARTQALAAYKQAERAAA